MTGKAAHVAATSMPKVRVVLRILQQYTRRVFRVLEITRHMYKINDV